MDNNKNKDEEHAKHHLNYHITVKIPQKRQVGSQESQNVTSATLSETQVSILPLESAKIVMMGSKKRKINSEQKFIHVSDQAVQNAISICRISKIKNLVFRPKLSKFISEEKERLAVLEETMMFQRERRFNKEEYMKKMQRVAATKQKEECNAKKFIRTEQKKKQQDKKFKRIKEIQQLSQEQKLIQARLLRKLREDPLANILSRIPEQLDQHYMESILIQASTPSLTHTGPIIRIIDESIIEQSSQSIDISSRL